MTSEPLENTIVNDDRSPRSERVRARKRLPRPSPSEPLSEAANEIETSKPKPAELERLSAEHRQEEAKPMSEATDTTVTNAVKLASEGLIAPGTSLLMDGDIKAGGAHLVVGLVAKSLLGPVGWLLVAASSFSKSATGKNLTEHFTTKKEPKETTTETVTT
jgi:hypothetical protein